MSRRNENWLLVEWGSGGRDVVYSKAVLHPVNRELKIGDKMTVSRRGDPQPATLIARAKERDHLEPRDQEPPAAGPSPKPDDDPEDYSPSGSSWAPSDEGAMSADSDKVGCSDKETLSAKKIKLEHCKRQYVNRKSGKKVLIPSYRANAIIPISMQDSKNDNRKRTHKGSFHKSLPDSTKRNNCLNTVAGKRTIDRELEEIGNSFRLLFKMIDDLKRPLILSNYNEVYQQNAAQTQQIDSPINAQLAEEEENDPYDPEEEFNRSDDNVLISNKYDSQYNASIALKDRVKTVEQSATESEKNEWVPIGSGKTLIHLDQFRKVNWKSYTIATRTLLLAVFPRRILATHSLTGKRSPAFQNKPAKMCLDPKIITDVIMEITDRFDVKENLVRSIITTKCADECKMLKQKNNKKKNKQNQDNKIPKKDFQEEIQPVS